MPGWRQPLGALRPPRDERRAFELCSIRDALCESASWDPQTARELFANVRDEWGSASDSVLRRQLDALVRDGQIKQDGTEYVLADAPEEIDL